MAKFYLGGGGASIKAAAVNDVQTDGGILRLRCRPSHEPAARAVSVFDGNQFDSLVFANLPESYIDLADHAFLHPTNALASLAKRFAGDGYCTIFKTVNAGIMTGKDIISIPSFTIDMEIVFNRVIGDDYIYSAAGSLLLIARTGQTLGFILSDGAGGLGLVQVDCTAWPLAIGGWYDIRATWDNASATATIEVRRGTDNARLSAMTDPGSGNVPLTYPVVDVFGRGAGIIGGRFNVGSATIGCRPVLSGDEYRYQRVAVYDEVRGVLADITDRPTYYAATSAGDADGVSAVATLDAGVAGSTWDPATMDADNVAAFATGIGAGGWEVRYQISNSGTPSAWSAWMTWASLIAGPPGVGRYFHLGLRATSDGYNEFYPVAWISAEATAPAGGYCRPRQAPGLEEVNP